LGGLSKRYVEPPLSGAWNRKVGLNSALNERMPSGAGSM
jgi:hypothetical protein